MEEKSMKILKPQTNVRTYTYCGEHFVIKKQKKTKTKNKEPQYLIIFTSGTEPYYLSSIIHRAIGNT